MRRLLPFLLLAAAWVSAADVPYYWYYYTVDTTDNPKYFSEIAFDAKGKLKIGYRRYYQVWYGELENHQFKIQQADTGIGASGKIAFALDKAGNPNILYHDDVYNHVYLARNDGTKWNHRTLDELKSATVDFYHIDMTAAADGGLHLLWTKRRPDADNSLKYGRIDAADKLVDTGFVMDGLNGKWNSIALDAQDRPVIAFFRHFRESLLVGHPDSAKFTIQEVGESDTLRPEGFYASLKRDTGNSFYLAHQNKNQRQLWLEHGTPGGTWTHEVVDTGVTFTLFHSPSVLGLGKDNAPYISYASIIAPLEDSIVGCKLMLARKEGDAWIKEVVDSAGIVGEYASLAMSPDGFPAISYYDRTNKRLRVAVARPEAPEDKDKNGIPDYQEIPSSIRRSVQTVIPYRPGMHPARVFDLRGRSWPVTGGGLVPAQGRWFLPSAEAP
jgi:hypothetical protein